MEYKLADLIDVPKLQELMDKFYAVTAAASAILDVDGTVLTATGWQDICTRYHRVHPDCAARCRESDAYINHHLDEGAGYVLYECRNGLVDVASPIIVNGKHIGTVFAGQFLLQSPDIAYFRQQSQEFGFDEVGYLEALANVPVVQRDKIEPILEYLTLFTSILADMGLQRLQWLETQRNLEQSEERFRAIADYTYDWESWIDTNGTVRWINPAVERFTGYTVEECLVMVEYPLPLVEESDRVMVANALNDARQGVRGNDLLFRIRHRDGSLRWMAMSWQPVYAATGTSMGYRTSTRDFTAAVQAEQERAALQQQVIDAQREALRELSSPLIPISDTAVVMPLVGTIDSARAMQIMEILLEGVAEQRATTTIIDITGVQVVDTQVASALVRAAQAVKLLGAEVVLTGIRPEMAQTLVHLGVDLSSILTLSSLQSGIAYALQQVRLPAPMRRNHVAPAR